MPSLVIEFKPAVASEWDHLGRFSATEGEIDALRSVLARHENPLDALNILPKGLVWDALDICRIEGHQVRVRFSES